MKRSDAIKLIGKFLVFGPSGFSKKKQEQFKNMSLGEMILTELEKAGMLPPCHKSSHCEGCGYNKWDEEYAKDEFYADGVKEKQ